MRQALVVDDHPLVRDGIKDLLEKFFPSLEITTSAGTGNVTEEVCGGAWAFVVLDVNLPDENGLDIIKRAKAKRPDLPIIVFSLYSERQYGARALRAGAAAYLSKDSPPQDLVALVGNVLQGRKIKQSIARQPVLSDREMEVLSLLTKGFGRKAISEQMNISRKTVSTYQARLMVKLEVRNLVELIRYAVEEGLAD
jgi:DNA-binding NarL/FixJ family response regulator